MGCNTCPTHSWLCYTRAAGVASHGSSHGGTCWWIPLPPPFWNLNFRALTFRLHSADIAHRPCLPAYIKYMYPATLFRLCGTYQCACWPHIQPLPAAVALPLSAFVFVQTQMQIKYLLGWLNSQSAPKRQKTKGTLMQCMLIQLSQNTTSMYMTWQQPCSAYPGSSKFLNLCNV